MIFSIVAIAIAFAFAAGIVLFVLPRIERKELDAEMHQKLFPVEGQEKSKRHPVKEKLYALKERLAGDKSDMNSETVYFLLLFLLNIQAGLPISSSLKRAYFSLSSMGFKITKYLNELISRMDSGIPFSQVLGVLDKFPEAKMLRESLSGIPQAREFGTPAADSVKNALESIQERRVIGAEAKASKLSVLLAIPIVFGFLPALVTLVAYPAVHQLFKTLKGLAR